MIVGVVPINNVRCIADAVAIHVPAHIVAPIVTFIAVVPEIDGCSRCNPNVLRVVYEIVQVETVS